MAAAWPWLADGGLTCVYCGNNDAAGTRAHPLLDERPVCARCEAARGGAGGALERVGHADAEAKYALDLTADGAPPPFPGGKRGRQHYLLSQVKEYAEDVHGSVDAALATASKYS